MKSYFLIGFEDPELAGDAIRTALPGQDDGTTWVLFDTSGDAIAYFYFGTNEYREFENFPDDANLITADVSGRHRDKEDKVIATLLRLQGELGGRIYDDDAAEIGVPPELRT